MSLMPALLVSPGCNTKQESQTSTHYLRSDSAVVLSGTSAAYVKVEATAPAPATLVRSLFGQVAFDERHLAAMGPPVQGRVTRVNAVVGDVVHKGDILLSIHAPDIAAARAAVAEARTARALAERNAERASLLVVKGAGSEAEHLTAVAALAQARSEEQRAVGTIAALGTEANGSSEYSLRAPIDGIVVERNVSVGSEVHTDQDQPVIKVADLSTVWVSADVYEQDLTLIKVGDEASVEVGAFPGKLFKGRITSLGNTVDAQTRAARARIELTNADHALRPGMFATISVKGAGDGALQLPLGAVLARRDQFFVFVQDESGAYHQREVRIGEQHGQHIAILEGLKPGEPVVTEGAILLDAEANEAL